MLFFLIFLAHGNALYTCHITLNQSIILRRIVNSSGKNILTSIIVIYLNNVTISMT